MNFIKVLSSIKLAIWLEIGDQGYRQSQPQTDPQLLPGSAQTEAPDGLH